MRAPRAGGAAAPRRMPSTSTIPQGTYDPVLGASYTQIAREGLGFQKSQNGGRACREPGEVIERLSSLRVGRSRRQDQEQSFFDGIDTSLAGIADAGERRRRGVPDGRRCARSTQRWKRRLRSSRAPHPEACAPGAGRGPQGDDGVDRRGAARADSADESKYDIRHELEIKRAQFNNALAQALGLTVSATVAPLAEPDGGGRGNAFMVRRSRNVRASPSPGETFGVRVHAVSQAPSGLKLERLSCRDPMGSAPIGGSSRRAAPPPGELAANKPAEHEVQRYGPGRTRTSRDLTSRGPISSSRITTSPMTAS